MKKGLTILVLAFTLTVFAQNNKPDESINLALLSDAKVSSSMEGRGEPSDILYNPKTKAYETATSYNEHGVGYGKTASSTVYWQTEWSELKYVNYITIGGSYSNQPQGSTIWEVIYNNGKKDITLDKGVGGWIDGGIYSFQITKPIEVKSIRIELTNVYSTTLRARGGKSKSIDDSETEIKATLIQYLPYEDDVVVIEPVEDKALAEIEALVKLLQEKAEAYNKDTGNTMKIVVVEIDK